MIKIILTTKQGVCWKFNLTRDMELGEIMECVEQQFYANQPKGERIIRSPTRTWRI